MTEDECKRISITNIPIMDRCVTHKRWHCICRELNLLKEKIDAAKIEDFGIWVIPMQDIDRIFKEVTG